MAQDDAICVPSVDAVHEKMIFMREDIVTMTAKADLESMNKGTFNPFFSYAEIKYRRYTVVVSFMYEILGDLDGRS